MTEQELKANFYDKLKTNYLGKNFIYYSKIDSTQSEIWRNVNTFTDGTLVMADIQISGKGTHGRVWHTQSNNIAFSFLIKPNCLVTNLDGLTLEIAQLIVEILKDKYDIEINIKKPNDLMKNGKKLGGILTETKINSEIAKFLVIGIGINNSQETFQNEIKDIATSIKNEFNKTINPIDFVAEFCNKFENILINRRNSKKILK